jgi:hypothetical protein
MNLNGIHCPIVVMASPRYETVKSAVYSSSFLRSHAVTRHFNFLPDRVIPQILHIVYEKFTVRTKKIVRLSEKLYLLRKCNLNGIMLVKTRRLRLSQPRNGAAISNGDNAPGRQDRSFFPSRERIGLRNIDIRTRALVTGTVGLLVWILIFGAGCLMDSASYRLVNDPAFRHQIIAKAEQPNQDPQLSPDARTVKRAKEIDAGRKVHWKTSITSFGMALLTFTPINLGLLCFLSGLMGGCSSQATYRRLVKDSKIGHESEKAANQGGTSADSVKGSLSETRLFYLSEEPITAAIRSFVVYLFMLAGFYLATGDPFKDMDSSQYLRMVGLVSCIAFAVGYDPSRFTELLDHIPKPGGGKP